MLIADPARAARFRGQAAIARGADDDAAAAVLSEVADGCRRRVLEMVHTAGLGHIGGSLSVLDVLTTLYLGVLDIDPERPDDPARDRFILSKGHCSEALYSVLAATGFIPAAALDTFNAPLSELNGHPNRRKVPGVETNTGALGHGLPVGVGHAEGARLTGSGARTYVVLGDGEMQEGSNWEALMYAAHRGLDNLWAIVDRNTLQQGARVADTNDLEPLADKLAAFGWHTVAVDGHDHLALRAALTTVTPGRPTAVIALTTKGKGVSFIEDRAEWHHKIPSAEQVAAGREELSR